MHFHFPDILENFDRGSQRNRPRIVTGSIFFHPFLWSRDEVEMSFEMGDKLVYNYLIKMFYIH